MMFLNRVRARLASPATGRMLLALHVLVLVASFVVFEPTASGDQATYIGLAEGLEQGTFSYWNGIYDPPPLETYRTHGYPAFLVAVRWFSHSDFAIKLAQALLYLAALWLAWRWLSRPPNDRSVGSVFLLLMLPQAQMLFYVHRVFPEIPMALCCTLAVVLGTRRQLGFRGILMLGLVLAAAFWVRPVMLLFPVMVLLGEFVLLRGAERMASIRGVLMYTAVFAVCGPLPFAAWNHAAHGTWRPVPISGSAVISNIGFWQLRLPGYGSRHYFQLNYFGREVVPWVSADEAEAHYARYQEQWRRIDAVAAAGITARDRELLPAMAADHYALFATRSAPYTLALDRAIAAENRKAILAEPGYYVATRVYTAVRLWITNINLPMQHVVYGPEPGARPAVGRPAGLAGWATAMVPFAISAVTFGLGGLLLVWRIMRNRKDWLAFRYALYLIAYLWVIHIPMSMQSRYLVPVHIVTVACIAIALVRPTRPAQVV